jgi:hypothetical protein
VDILGGGEAPDVGASILVIIDEVPEGYWGARGRTISLSSIADSVGLPKDGERYAWVQAYFDAKRRAYAAAGYPANIGGLLPPQRRQGRRDIADLAPERAKNGPVGGKRNDASVGPATSSHHRPAEALAWVRSENRMSRGRPSIAQPKMPSSVPNTMVSGVRP